jgi:pimeloyl-ACP methyl ester carboxylesterase
MLDLREQTFGGTFLFAPRYLDRDGLSLHYVDEGAGARVLFVRGDPAWGYLWRAFIGPLSKSFRVVVPDHMGMGKSELWQTSTGPSPASSPSTAWTTLHPRVVE